MTRYVMRASGEARSRRTASLVFATLALIVVGLAVPAAGSAKQLECTHPEFALAVPTPAVVGIPWRAPAAIFWCLEPGDQLADAMINWGDGTVSAGAVSYSKPERSRPLHGAVREPVMVKTAQIGGAHVYTRVPRGGAATITFAATDLPAGTVLTSYANAPVLPRDLARPVTLHISGDEVDGPVAHVRVAYDAYTPDHRLSARIDWGDGRRSPGTVVEPSRRIDTGTQLFTVRGRHRWRREGAHTITVIITDEVGPQHLVVRDHVPCSYTRPESARRSRQLVELFGPREDGREVHSLASASCRFNAAQRATDTGAARDRHASKMSTPRERPSDIAPTIRPAPHQSPSGTKDHYPCRISSSKG